MKEKQHPGSAGKPRYIADRYRVQKRLGMGGIAEVYHVVDEVTNRALALKLLFQEASQKQHLAALFEREFHTLAQLAHPRIIEVYDYGVHSDRAYYTMELLAGSDLKKLVPIEWRHACRLLRDVALSLTLIHSRRLLHRDISARNVRCDKDGRAKLIDFGALSPLGATAKLVGTAAFIAPEAFNHQHLDQRTDLYSLGALAYLLITGRYAYRAHYVRHLKDAWRSRPPSVIELKPEVPRPLSDLVMSLLSLDRMARPVYASDVVEMLTAYAGLEPDDTVEIKQAYLATPRLVGRDAVVTELLKRILRLFGCRGGHTLLFEGPSGMGRSRLLAELVLESKVVGTTVLSTGSEAALLGPYGVALELTEQLFDTAYDLASEAIRPNLALLTRAFPNLASLINTRAQNRTVDTIGFDTKSQELKENGVEFSNPGEAKRVERLAFARPGSKSDDALLRPQIQKALLDLFLEVGRSRQLVIAIDDFHLVDEPSAALLSSLALETRARSLMVAVSAEQDKIPSASAAYQTLLRIAHRIEVGPLDQNAVNCLLRSIFGDTANMQMFAKRIYEISRGNPRAVLQLAQHLIDQGVIRYSSGAWTIPSLIDTKDLPASLLDALRSKVGRLDAEALGLVATLALSSERNFSFEECLLLSESADAARLTKQLNSLVASEVLVTDGRFYSFGQEAFKTVLAEGLNEATARGAHVKLAKLFQQRDRIDFRVVQHLIKAGKHHDALDLLIEHIETTLKKVNEKREAQLDYIRSLAQGWSETIADAMHFVEQLNRPRRQRDLINYFAVRMCSAIGLVKKDDFRSVIHRLVYDSGLDIYHEIDNQLRARTGHLSGGQADLEPDQPNDPEEIAKQRLDAAIKLATQRYENTDPLMRGFSPSEAIQLLPGAVMAAAALSSTSIDYSVLEMLPSLQPLFPLSPTMKVLQEHVRAVGYIVGASYDNAREKYLSLLQWVAGPASARMDQAYREYMRCSFNFAVGLIETIGIPTALERAEAIDQHPIYQVNAWLVRFLYYLRQGDFLKTQKCRQTLELLQLQHGPAQMFEAIHWFPALTTYAIYDDLTGVNQAMNEIEKMARRFESWVPIARYARGEHYRIRGEYARALEDLDEALNQTTPARDVIWAYAACARLKILAELDRLTEAHALALEYLKQAEQAELNIVLDQILLPLAIIEARLGQEESAEKRVERTIAIWNDLGASSILLGWAFETGARVAIYADRPSKFRKYAKLCRERYRAGEHPLLTARYSKLTEDARLAYLGVSPETKKASELTVALSRGGDLASGLQDYLAKYQGEQELYQGALDLMIKRTGSSEGYLFIATNSALKLVVQISVQPPPERLVESLQASFIKMVEADGEPEISETVTGTASETDDWPNVITEVDLVDRRFLSAEVDGRRVPLGAVILRYERQSYDRVEQAFFDAIASCLYRRTRKLSQTDHDQSLQAEPLVDQSRYQIEKLLGEGGMASVYEIRDRETGKRLALKRARVVGSTDIDTRRNKLENSLRREYQMLKSLAHPRIVEVFDFGVDQEGPYYTMELLEGTSLRQMAPLQWKEACPVLRDLASALAFLHARRLLHRDVSPRNIGMTADNHIKLMDFGTTAPMGIATDRVGTPPFIPPEVVYRQKLDHRSDLYSFGALAYWLLTGRHAYPARNIDELKNLWGARPQSVSELVSKLETLDLIPETLNQLVMSLLSIDPLARPPSAAEVLERLSAIASMPVDEQLSVPQAYLTTPTLVGRQWELLNLRKQVIRCIRHRGGAVLIHGASGLGRSRLLDACVMEAKLAGMIVLKAETRSAGRSDYAVVKTLARQLMEEIPDIARSAATPYLSRLTRIVPGLADSAGRGAGLVDMEPRLDGDSSQQPATLRELRPQIQVALREWIVEIGSQRAIMLAVDDLHLTDEPSAAFLALLAQVIADKRVLVVATTVSSTQSLPSATAIDIIREAGTPIEIKELNLEATQQLLGSLFGQASNVRLLADRLYGLSQGNPGVVMQLAQHLVDTQVIRYQGGTWKLPAQMDGTDLPSSLKETYKARILKLDPDALQLAQTMALSPEQSFIFEECLMLTEHRDADRTAVTLDELVAFEVIGSDGERFTSSYRGWVSVLQEQMDKAAGREGHRRLAEVFSARDAERFRVGYHLIRACEEEQAIDVMLDFCRQSRMLIQQNPETYNQILLSLPRDWFQTLRVAIDLAKKNGRPLEQIYTLKSRLSSLGAIMGMIDRHHTQDLLDRLYRDCGLELYRDLRESPGEQQRLQQALKLAQQQYDATPESERVRAPMDAIRELATILLEAISPTLIFADYSFWKSLPSIKPLASLSPTLEIIDKLAQAIGDEIGGRPERYYIKVKEIIKRLEHPDHAGFEGAHYSYLHYGMVFAMGYLEASMGNKSALERAKTLETSTLLQVNAWQIRKLYYLWQGTTTEAINCKKQVETLQIRNSPSRTWFGLALRVELRAYCLTDDLSNLKDLMDEVEKMTSISSAWIPSRHYARGEYQRIRGDYAGALAELKEGLRLCAPGHHPFWAAMADAYLKTLLALERYEQVRSQAREFIQAAEVEDLGYMGNYLRMSLALAEANLKESDSAVQNAEAVVDSFEKMGAAGLNLGLAYETRARVAILIDDEAGFEHYARLCADRYLAGGNSSLRAKYERLMQEARQADLAVPPVHDGTLLQGLGWDTDRIYRETREKLAVCRDLKERADRALTILADHCEADGGYIFALQGDGLRLLSKKNKGPAPEQLFDIVRVYLEAELKDSPEATITVADENAAQGSNPTFFLQDGTVVEFVLIHGFRQDQPVVVGVAVLIPAHAHLLLANPTLVFAVNDALLETGEVTSRMAA
ncbi:MAG: protein kinase [Deltaproteobacteria bacterium]|nr:protein kinase [Deltaproteobacteria bacterium]